MKGGKLENNKKLLGFFCALATFATAIFLNTTNVSAGGSGDTDTCMSRAQSMYDYNYNPGDASYLKKYNKVTGAYESIYGMNRSTFSNRCNEVWENAKNGTVVPDYEPYPEWTSPKSISFTIRRVIYTLTGGGGVNACIKINTPNVTVSSNREQLPLKDKNGNYKWPREYLTTIYGDTDNNSWSHWWKGGTATVSVSEFSGSPTSLGGGLFQYAINFTTYLFCKEGDNQHSNTMYYKFYKITQIKHATPTMSISSDANNPTIVSSSDSITFTHKLSRNDGWGGSSANLENVYSFDGGSSWSDRNFGSSGAWADISEVKKVSDLGLAQGTITKVCSTLTYYNYRGLSGQSTTDTTTNTSSICGYVRLDRIITATNLGYSSATTSVGSTTYDVTNSSLVPDPDGATYSVNNEGGVLVEDYHIDFLHKVATVNGEGNKVKFKYKIEQRVNGGSWTTIVSDKEIEPRRADGWLIVRNATGNSAEKFKLTFGESKTICERLTIWDTSVTYNNNGTTRSGSSGTGTSTVCATIKRKTPLDTEQFTGLKSSVDVGGVSASNTQSNEKNKATFEGISRIANYSVNFGHYLKFPAPASPYSYGAQNFTYTVERKVNNGSYAVVSGEQNLSASVSPDGEYHLLKYNGDVNVNIPNFDTTATICERVTVRPKSITFFELNAKPSQPNNNPVSSEVCAEIYRPKPITLTITAATSADVDGATATNEKIYYALNENRQVIFYHEFAHNFDAGKTLDTKYTIEYTVNSEKGTKTASISTPKLQSHTYNLKLSYNEKVKICERVVFSPSTYYLHTDNVLESLTTTGASEWLCVNVVRPGPTPTPDPDPNPDPSSGDNKRNVTVTATSEGLPAHIGQETSSFNSDLNAYLVKTSSVDLIYFHQFHRDNVTHTDNKKTPTEPVIINYRFDDPSANFSASSLTDTFAGSLTINNNSSSEKLASDATNSLKNKNTKITSVPVSATPTTICQNAHYLSGSYKSWGVYWMVDGVRLDELDSNIPGASDLLDHWIESNNEVGKSSGGCVNLLRPYNFKVTKISATLDEPESGQIAYADTTITANFSATVEQNDSEYLLTDIPDARVQAVGFVIYDAPQNFDATGVANTDASPCGYFENKLGATNCVSLYDEKKNICAENTANCGSSSYITNDYTYRFPEARAEIGKLPLSAKYCIAVGVAPTNSGAAGWGLPDNFNTNWTISNASCINIGKKPTFQVWGGSVFTNGGVASKYTTTTSGSTKATFGSWADYMILAGGKISGAASGAALISGYTGNDSATATTRLSIANADPANAGYSGVVSANVFTERIFERYLTDNNKYHETTVLDADAIATASSHRPAIIYSPGDLYITANLSAVGSNQYIIFAQGNINVANDVTTLDAWLLAPNGELRTCASANGASLRTSAATCTNRLKIRGAVYAKNLVLDRTSGADIYADTVKEAAEIIDLSPMSYIFGYNESAKSMQPFTTYLHKLPPRY